MNDLQQPSRQRLRNGFAFLIAAAGLGLCGYAGLLWHALPSYSEKDIQASTELNLAIDLTRQDRQNSSSQPPDKDSLRKQVRSEVEADIVKERQWPLQWFRSGLVLIALALLMAWPSLSILGKKRTSRASWR